VSAPIPKKISQILPKFQNVAQTSHYIVQFGMPSDYGKKDNLRSFLRGKGIDSRFHTEDIGLLCSSAVLPGSTFATTVVNGEYQGVTETIPHTRNFTRIKLEFYVDNEYKSLKFLEHWMEFITGNSDANPLDDAYNFRLNYPEDYRSQSTKIIKFEKNYRQSLEYNFRGLFPIALDSTRVQYQNSTVLKASCAFAYERYICGEATSFSQSQNKHQNRMSIDARNPAHQRSNFLNGQIAGNDERLRGYSNSLDPFKVTTNLTTNQYFSNDGFSGATVTEGVK
tara:strand:- start:61 stop:903 length:843 start_codon:yes stop_codon:yes gene_type:complete